MIEFNFNESSGNFPKCQGIYAIRGKHNNYHLVGQTQQLMKQRWSQHRQKLRQGKHDNSYLQHSFNKHGEDNFSFVLIEECSEPNKFNERECFWIRQLSSMKNKQGWNLRDGGAYGLYVPELRKKVSEGIRNSLLAKASREARSKTYTLKSPRGEIITFTNRSRFCKERGLINACLWRVFNRKVSHHKGWTLP